MLPLAAGSVSSNEELTVLSKLRGAGSYRTHLPGAIVGRLCSWSCNGDRLCGPDYVGPARPPSRSFTTIVFCPLPGKATLSSQNSGNLPPVLQAYHFSFPFNCSCILCQKSGEVATDASHVRTVPLSPSI